MEKQLSEIERILNIPNREMRREELCKFARSVGMLPSNNPSAKGYTDQRIVLAIYDGLVQQGLQATKTKKIFIIICVLAVVMTFAITVIPKSAQHYFRFYKAKYGKKQKTFQGIDDEGKVVRDDQGQPVLFRELDGIYDEYYDDGALHFTFRYVEGDVKEMTEYDKSGKMISHIVFDKLGNPILEKKY